MLIFTLPIIIMMLAAIIPGIVLMKYIYRKDRLDKEPRSLLVRLFILGIISTVLAVFTETVGMGLVNVIWGDRASTSFIALVIENFIVVALSEEGFKYLVLKRATWKNPEFNCTFDAVVYAVFVSLGFAVWENIQYVFSYGFGTALVRAITAVPGHTCFGVLMGAYYGMAKKYESKGDLAVSQKARKMAVIMPVLAHGAYDFFATVSSGLFSGMFIIVIVVLYFICYNLVKGLSENDTYIQPTDPDFSYKDAE